jgi:hypothetical protein
MGKGNGSIAAVAVGKEGAEGGVGGGALECVLYKCVLYRMCSLCWRVVGHEDVFFVECVLCRMCSPSNVFFVECVVFRMCSL